MFVQHPAELLLRRFSTRAAIAATSLLVSASTNGLAPTSSPLPPTGPPAAIALAAAPLGTAAEAAAASAEAPPCFFSPRAAAPKLALLQLMAMVLAPVAFLFALLDTLSLVGAGVRGSLDGRFSRGGW